MKPLFQDYQVRKFSHNDKIKWVFEQLLIKLNPVTLSTIKETGWYDGKWKPYTIIKASCNTDKININIPFPDISLSVTKDSITIEGNDFEYKFAPDMILMVWNRMQNAIR